MVQNFPYNQALQRTLEAAVTALTIQPGTAKNILVMEQHSPYIQTQQRTSWSWNSTYHTFRHCKEHLGHGTALTIHSDTAKNTLVMEQHSPYIQTLQRTLEAAVAALTIHSDTAKNIRSCSNSTHHTFRHCKEHQKLL